MVFLAESSCTSDCGKVQQQKREGNEWLTAFDPTDVRDQGQSVK